MSRTANDPSSKTGDPVSNSGGVGVKVGSVKVGSVKVGGAKVGVKNEAAEVEGKNDPPSDTTPASVARRSSQELLDTVRRIENAVSKGTAQIEDYEAFVLCQGELSRRQWHEVFPTSFR